MKHSIMALLVFISIPSFADEAFLGPILTCELSNEDYDTTKLKFSVYTTSPFGLSPVINILYSFPEFDDENEASFISPLKSAESGQYEGKITNIDYLVDVKVNLGNEELRLTDDGVEYLFSGTCR